MLLILVEPKICHSSEHNKADCKDRQSGPILNTANAEPRSAPGDHLNGQGIRKGNPHERDASPKHYFAKTVSNVTEFVPNYEQQLRVIQGFQHSLRQSDREIPGDTYAPSK